MINKRNATIEEFERFIERPENTQRRFELIDGEIIEVSPSKDRQTIIGARLVYFLNAHVIPRDLGYVTAADGGFKLSNEDFFAPDVAFISKARFPAIQDAYFNIAPDLAIEVISPSESEPDIAKKISAYLRIGTKIVWTVYPKTKTVVVHTSAGSQVFGIGDVLDGGEVLPGFQLPISDIFPA